MSNTKYKVTVTYTLEADPRMLDEALDAVQHYTDTSNMNQLELLMSYFEVPSEGDPIEEMTPHTNELFGMPASIEMEREEVR